MTYTVIPSDAGYFMLPAEAVRSLKLAGAAQLKTLIALYHRMGAPVDSRELSALTGLSEGDASDALLFWIEKGLVRVCGELTSPTPAPVETQAKAEPVRAEKPQKSDGAAEGSEKHIPKLRPTIAQINQRSREDPEIRELFLQAQTILGRTIGYDTQAQLLLCCDYLGLPVSVVLMICEYARSVGKSGIAYIASTAENWAREGIFTLEQANKKIAALEETRRVWTDFARQVGITTPSPSKAQEERLEKWIGAYGYDTDCIVEAYDEMAEHIAKFSMAYMDKTLTAWHEKGLTDLSAIRAYRAQYKEQQEKKKTDETRRQTKNASGGTAGETSYDLAQAEEKASGGAPIYRRKKK